jgi:hypothetical protein
VQVSDNGSTWQTIHTTTSGNGGFDDLAISGSGRYVRVSGTARATDYGYSLWEFGVYRSAPRIGRAASAARPFVGIFERISWFVVESALHAPCYKTGHERSTFGPQTHP